MRRYARDYYECARCYARASIDSSAYTYSSCGPLPILSDFGKMRTYVRNSYAAHLDTYARTYAHCILIFSPQPPSSTIVQMQQKRPEDFVPNDNVPVDVRFSLSHGFICKFGVTVSEWCKVYDWLKRVPCSHTYARQLTYLN